MDADRLIEELSALTIRELRRVHAAAESLLAHYAEAADPDYGRTQEPPPEGKTYRQEYVRCGKERCKRCADGAGHGPYWYAYWSEKGRTRKQYIGKTYREI